MECFKYAFNMLTVSDGMFSINLGGLQADLMGGSGGGGAPPVNKYILRLRPCRRPPFDEQATDHWMTLKMGHFLYQNCYFGDLDVHVGVLSDHFGGPWGQGDTQ